MSDTLVLDTQGFPISFVSWQRAINLQWSDRAVVVSEDAEKKCAFLNEVTGLARQYKAERKLPLNAEIASADISCGFALASPWWP